MAELKQILGIVLISLSASAMLVLVMPSPARQVHLTVESLPETVFSRYLIDSPTQTYSFGIVTRRDVALLEIRFSCLRPVELIPAQADLFPLECEPEDLARGLPELGRLINLSEELQIPYRREQVSLEGPQTKAVVMDFFDLMEASSRPEDLPSCGCTYVFACDPDGRLSRLYVGAPDFMPSREMLRSVRFTVDGRETYMDGANATAGVIAVWEARTGSNVLVTITGDCDPNDHTEETKRILNNGCFFLMRAYADGRLQLSAGKFLSSGL